jgi:hypothetical protein
MTSARRTEFTFSILDLIDFIDEKICEAIADESLRAAAVSEAAGALPCCATACARTRLSRPSSSWCLASIFTDRSLRSGGPSSLAWTGRHSRKRPRPWWAGLLCCARSLRPAPGHPSRLYSLAGSIAG